jgi:DNA segregation ATPase FtsK/SpoIIIE-like protein
MPINFSRIEEQIYSLKPLEIPIGINLDSNNPVCIDIAESPHTLIAGISGFGKSSLVNVIFASVRMREENKSLSHYVNKNDSMTTRLIYLNPLMLDSKRKRFPNSVSEHCVDDIAGQLDKEVKRMKSLYDKNPSPTLLVIDEVSLVCDDKANTENLELIAKTGRHSNYHLFLLTQFPTLDSFGDSSLIKQNLHNQIVFRCGDSVRSAHSILPKDMHTERLYKKGECLVRTPNILSNYGKALHCQAFFLSDNEVGKYIKEAGEQGRQGEGENINKAMLKFAIETLQSKGEISIRIIREQFRVQPEPAKKIIEFLQGKGIINERTPGNGRCKINSNLPADSFADLLRIVENPQGEHTFADSDNSLADLVEESNVISINQYLLRR